MSEQIYAGFAKVDIESLISIPDFALERRVGRIGSHLDLASSADAFQDGLSETGIGQEEDQRSAYRGVSHGFLRWQNQRIVNVSLKVSRQDCET